MEIRAYHRGAAVLAIAWLLSACATQPQSPAPVAPAPVQAPTAPPPAPPPAPAVVEPAPPPPPPPPVQAVPAKRPSELALRSAIDLYEDGKFDEAARAIQNAREIWSDPEKEVRIEAHKIAAFSYCVTNRRTQCRRQFDALLRIEPGFQLKPTEAGHPLWGPVFQQAKRASDARKKR